MKDDVARAVAAARCSTCTDPARRVRPYAADDARAKSV